MTQDEASPLMRIAVGVVLGISGLAAAILGLRKLLLASNPLQDEAMAVTLIGFCILFFGVMIFLPNVVGFRSPRLPLMTQNSRQSPAAGRASSNAAFYGVRQAVRLGSIPIVRSTSRIA